MATEDLSLPERFPALLNLGRRRRIPYVQQLSAMECGAACLTMLLAYHGKNVPLEELKPGIPVTLQIAANGKTVLRVVATDRRKGAQ